MNNTLVIENNLECLERVFSFIDSFVIQNNLPSEAANDFNLAVEELVTNSINYGFADNNSHEIFISMEQIDNIVTVIIEDDGIEFNPFLKEKPESLTQSLEEKSIGGLGIYFVKMIMTEYHYERLNNRNTITLRKSYSDL